MSKSERDIIPPEYTITNKPGSADRILDCNQEAGALLVADVLATLIEDLHNQGILKGTFA